MFYGKFFLLVESFLISRRLQYELPKSTSHLLSVPLTPECVRILSYPSFFSTSIISLVKFCVRLISELIMLLSTNHVKIYLTCCHKSRKPISCNLIMKIKVKICQDLYICQDLVLKVIYSSLNIKSCYLELVSQKLL